MSETTGERIAEITSIRPNEGPLLRADIPRKRVRIRWDAVLTMVIVFAVGVLLGMAAQYQVDHAMIPACTDEIATEGGICQGPLQ